MVRNPGVSVSTGTLQLLLKMTAKEPENRFDSWDELMKAMDYAAASRPLGVRAKTPAPAATIQSTMLLKSKLQTQHKP